MNTDYRKDRRSLQLISHKILLISTVALFISGLTFSPQSSTKIKRYRPQKSNFLQTLKQIYKEVAELGSYNDEDFIKREFFMELDGNQENREEHVVIFQRKVGERQEMLIQVTYFKSKRKGSNIKYAEQAKEIVCFFPSGKAEIIKCDYAQDVIQSLLAKILAGVCQKKKYLKLIKNKLG